VRLIDAPEHDAFAVLGIQAERLELNEKRLAVGRPVPSWNSMETFDRVLSPQRAPADELARYARRGVDYAKRLLDRIAPALHQALCDGAKVRPEVEKEQEDVKGAIKYVASVALGAVIASIPAALAVAAAGIAATIAVILLKRKLTTFCANGSGRRAIRRGADHRAFPSSPREAGHITGQQELGNIHAARRQGPSNTGSSHSANVGALGRAARRDLVCVMRASAIAFSILPSQLGPACSIAWRRCRGAH
jgi:hypothetical protein